MPISKAEYQDRRRERRPGSKTPTCDEDRCRSNTLAGYRCPNAKVTVTLPLVGRKIDEENGKPTRVKLTTCMAHSPEYVRRSVGFVGHGKGGRPKTPTVPQAMRQMVERQAGEVIQPLFEGLQADRPVVVGNGAHARLEMVPDPSVRMRATDALLDRVYGKPKQTTELSGAGGEPVRVSLPSDEERAQEVARILSEAGVG